MKPSSLGERGEGIRTFARRAMHSISVALLGQSQIATTSSEGRGADMLSSAICVSKRDARRAVEHETAFVRAASCVGPQMIAAALRRKRFAADGAEASNAEKPACISGRKQ